MTDSGPVLRVIRGDATPEEIAAVVAALLSARRRFGRRPRPGPRRPRGPTAPACCAAPCTPAPDAWRRSALPG